MTPQTPDDNSRSPLPVDQDSASHFLDHGLAVLLSRLAGLQGYAVPAHRFGMMSVSQAGTEIENMSRDQRAMELWLGALPGGTAEELDGLPERGDLPALWVADDGNTVRLLRGALSNGGYSCEEANGRFIEISADETATGRTLVLLAERGAAIGQADQPKSARAWFFYAIRKRRGPFIEAVVATFLVSVLALVTGFYTMQVYDRVVPTQSYSTLTVLTIGVLLAIGLELLMSQVRARIVDRASKAIDLELSGVFFDRMLQIRMDARPKTVGTFAGQIRQFEVVRNFMTSTTLFLMADAPFALFFIWVIWLIGGIIALVPLALLPVAILAGLYAKWRVAKLAGEQLRDSNIKNGLLVESIDGIEAIKAAGGEWKMLDRWQKMTADAAERELRIRSTTMLSSSMGQTIQRVTYIGLIAVGAYSIGAGLITQGALMGCAIISNRALAPIMQIAGMFVQWQHAKAALQGLDEMMALPRDRAEGVRQVIPESCQGEVRLEGASFSYVEGSVALQPSNLHILPGERIAIIGPVGSGKSTLIKLLTGLYKPTEGRAFLDGIDMAQLAPEFMREHIGYLTQDIRLFNGTLRENLTIGLPSPSDGQIFAAAERTGLDRLIKSHPKGLELPISEGGRGLSGGQRQVVGLTRLQLAKPRILILDEPTAAMDGDLENFVMHNMFADASSDTVIVLATHKRSMLRLVNRILVVDQGRIMLDAPRDEALAKLASQAPRRAKLARADAVQTATGEAA